MSGGRPPRVTRAVGVALLIVGPLGPLGAVGALAGGCARASARPGVTLSALAAALARKDYDAAYALTSADFRARVPLVAFRAELEDGGAGTEELARRLRAAGEREPARVMVELAPAEPLGLVEEGGRWLVDDPTLFEPWSQKTPRAALRAFVRALEQGRYDVVLRLCPAQRRAKLSIEALRAYWEGPHKAENAELVARLRAALGAPIVEIGDEARLPYGVGPSGGEIDARLVREDGVWRIEDPD